MTSSALVLDRGGTADGELRPVRYSAQVAGPRPTASRLPEIAMLSDNKDFGVTH